MNQGTGSGSVTAVSVSGAGFQTKSLAALPATVAANQTFSFQLRSPHAGRVLYRNVQFGHERDHDQRNSGGRHFFAHFFVAYTDPGRTTPSPYRTGHPGVSEHPGERQFEHLPGSDQQRRRYRPSELHYIGRQFALAVSGSESAFPAGFCGAFPEAAFSIRFSPLLQDTFSATLTLNLNGQTVTVTLSGQGTGPQYTYTWASATANNAVTRRHRRHGRHGGGSDPCHYLSHQCGQR